jgi:competence ComEA-like helix-hairpin-helix protein
MFRKIVLVSMICSSFSLAMSVSTVQTVKKEKLGCIKGLGVKRVEAIISYRKSHELSSLEELLNVKGIGKGILNNIKEDKEKKVCTNFKPLVKKKKDIKAE